jgi:hypothetical protein
LENQSVVVFDLFHCCFSRQWVFNDVKCVHAISGWNCLTWVFWITGQSEGFWTTESNWSADFTETSSEWSLDSLQDKKIH